MADSVRRKGIFYGWFIVAVGFFALFVSNGARNSFGVFIIPMSEDFDWSRGQISAAIAIGWLANGLAQPFLGRLYDNDRFGGRVVISASLLVLGVGTMLLSLTNNVWFLIVIYGLVMSTSIGGISLVTVHAVLSKWFYRKRGIVMSASTAGASAGALVLAPFATYLILWASWRVAWFVLGAFVIFLALPLALLLIRNEPADIGEVPDGDTDDSDSRERLVGKTFTFARTPLETDDWRDSLRTHPMWQLTGAYFVCGMTTAIISAHYVPFAIDRGASPGLAATAFGLMMGLNIAGVLLVGMFSDKMRRKNLLGTVYAVRCLAYATLVFIPGALGLWTFAIVAGFSWIATAPLTSSLTADIYGVKNIGTLNGFATFAHMVGGAVSVLMAGVLYDIMEGYEVPFGIAGAMLLGASITAYSIREGTFSIRYRQPSAAATTAIPASDGD